MLLVAMHLLFDRIVLNKRIKKIQRTDALSQLMLYEDMIYSLITMS